jgi:dTDP-4-amino-4,6-dideoxygalactose transaminase
VIIHTGAKPTMVDVNPEDFNLSIEAVRKAITPKTKAIIGVDIGGYLCDYEGLFSLVNEPSVQSLFCPRNEKQELLNRIIILSDAAHSFGATYNNKVSGSIADVTVFSFHAVKNLTTAEGGAIAFNLPDSFSHETIYAEFNTKILHGQNKDALSKTQKGNWRYDVIEPGYKCNMTDIQAAIGLVELDRYHENLKRRKEIFEKYDFAFKNESWAILPKHTTKEITSSYHLYLLRVSGKK